MVSSIPSSPSTSAFAAAGAKGTAQQQPKADAKTKQGLTEAEQKQVTELRDRDREVRAHEAAHLAVAGSYAIGGINLQLTKGPDGVMYATGGDVQIDTSAVSGDPAATIRKAETIRRAAMAPASPSPQDRRVAAMAGKMILEAQAELALKTRKSPGEDGASAYSKVSAIDSASSSSSGLNQVA